MTWPMTDVVLFGAIMSGLIVVSAKVSAYASLSAALVGFWILLGAIEE